MANALASIALLLCFVIPATSLAAQAIRPAWKDLTATQRSVLAPLEADWERFSAEQR